MVLAANTKLQQGKYRIVTVLGQGGFGISYLAENVMLGTQVAVKEFFMKEYCDRDRNTSAVTTGSIGSRDIVDKFKLKFMREAKMIASMNNPHIVRILDIFEENGTAYYVMDYHGNGSLMDKVKACGPLSESIALRYIRQVADALDYIHKQNILHLDVKPSNILISDLDDAIMIDFGISKHYDDTGSQTSTTPVGISKGYAPLEQYQQGNITKFSPATDIYSLGATLFYLLSGSTPPDANEVYEDGLPKLSQVISIPTRNAISSAMNPRRKDRPQSAHEFVSLLGAVSPDSNTIPDQVYSRTATSFFADEKTVLSGGYSNNDSSSPQKINEKTTISNHQFVTEPPKQNEKKWYENKLVIGLFIVVVVVGGLAELLNDSSSDNSMSSASLNGYYENIQFEDGSIYTGQFLDSYPEGAGTLVDKDGTKITGTWKQGDLVPGEVVIEYSTGEKYSGSWNNGRNGKGTYEWPEKRTDYMYKYVGEWRDNKRHGKGTAYYVGGHTLYGEWKEDELVSDLSQTSTNTSNNTSNKAQSTKKSNPKLSATSITLKSGEAKVITLSDAEYATVKWSISDDAIASIKTYGKSCTVVGGSAGHATIRVEIDGVSLNCDVNVENDNASQSNVSATPAEQKPKTEALSNTGNVPVVISGTVLDAGKKPVVGAAVMLKGTASGTTTDIDGKFSIKAKAGDIIAVSARGYKTEYKVDSGASGLIIYLQK